MCVFLFPETGIPKDATAGILPWLWPQPRADWHGHHMGTQALFTREAAHKYPLTFTWQNNESNSFSKITLLQTAFDKKKMIQRSIQNQWKNANFSLLLPLWLQQWHRGYRNPGSRDCKMCVWRNRRCRVQEESAKESNSHTAEQMLPMT